MDQIKLFPSDFHESCYHEFRDYNETLLKNERFRLARVAVLIV